MEDTFELRKISRKYADTLMQYTGIDRDRKVTKPILYMAANWIDGNGDRDAVFLIAVEREKSDVYEEYIHILLAVDDGTFISWHGYEDMRMFRNAWRIYYEFPRVLMEKTRCL